MSNAVALSQPQNHVAAFSPDDIQLIRETLCKGATETEIKLFLGQAKATGLNPLARQIFAVMRWDGELGRKVMSIQVSIDGFRLIAERTGKYAGQTAPQWCDDDGIWKDVWLSAGPPAAARVGVIRHDFKEPCYGIARFDSYKQTKKGGGLNSAWEKMGDVMIAKCAESLALRKAFPQELSGLYTPDEMAQASVEPEPTETPVAVIAAPVDTKPNKEAIEAEAKHIIEQIKAAATVDDLMQILSDTATALGAMRTSWAKMHARVMQIATERRTELEAEGGEVV